MQSIMIRNSVRCALTSMRVPRRQNFGFFDEASRDWDKAWNMQLTPWDLKGTVAPPLIQACESGVITLPSAAGSSHALVPGCGTGYECLYLAELGFKVTGLDLSPKAIQNATDHLNTKIKDEKIPQQTKDALANVNFVVDSFFDMKHNIPVSKYDVIFDYLFFSALDPPARKQWASAMSRVIAPKSGVLLTLIFPLNTGSQNPLEGPPYPVTLQDYKDALEPLGFTAVATEKVMYWSSVVCILTFLQNVKSIKPRLGRELLVYWSKE